MPTDGLASFSACLRANLQCLKARERQPTDPPRMNQLSVKTKKINKNPANTRHSLDESLSMIVRGYSIRLEYYHWQALLGMRRNYANDAYALPVERKLALRA